MDVCQMENVTPCKYAWEHGIGSFCAQISIPKLKMDHGQRLFAHICVLNSSLQGTVTFSF